MQAREVMTSRVISVSPETSVRHVAQILLRHRISAVPVIDDDLSLVGMVSEGDLMERPELGAQRSDWWLGLLDCPEAKALEYVRSHGKQAKEVMTTSVITVAPETPLSRIAAVLEEERIKRVPVVENGRVIGIVSRADLLRAMASAPEDQTAPGDDALRLAILTRLREDAGLENCQIKATTSEGIVHLWGSVPSDPHKQAAGVAVRTVRGVRGFVDHVVVDGEAGQRQAPNKERSA